MTAQSSIFQTRSSWHHFVGGYYSSVEKFIAEARRIGISRRVPAQSAKGMRFGDRIVFLRWNGKDPAGRARVEAFAEGRITSVILADGLGRAVGEELAAEGRATFSDSGAGVVSRECGSYFVCGGWSVDADLPELIERAERIAKERAEKTGEKIEVFCMIAGSLSEVYPEPALLSPAPAFSRGFTRIADPDASFVYEPPAGSLVLVDNYQKGARK